MNEKLFSKMELKELESLKVYGGSGEINPLAQAGCINESMGCGDTTILQDKCVNAVIGCTKQLPVYELGCKPSGL